MTVITGTVEDIGMEPLSGVLVATSVEFRTSGDIIIAPESRTYPITDGVVWAELVPGPTRVTVQVGSHARDGWDVVVPGSGSVTLASLIDDVFEWTPEQISRFAQLRDEAVAAAGRAETAANEFGLTATATTGAAGSNAAVAVTGDGPAYALGFTVPRGDKGERGERGPQGIQGIQGDTGEQGIQGIQGDTGPKGDKGDTGDTGPKGDTGLKGDTGERGPQGVQGPKGDKGDTGEIGPKGDTGDTGPKGDKGDKGDQGEPGPKGDPGDLGPEGPQGPPGADGGSPTWGGISGKPEVFPPETHTHPSSQVSDATATGRAVMTAASQSAARTAIGAGTSSLALGTTASTAKAGNYQPTWAQVTGKPATFPPATHSHTAAEVGAEPAAWSGTQAQFDALGAKSPNRTYYIVD